MDKVIRLINMDFPDPDVIRVGDVYYMISTTMHFCPGAQILSSKDLLAGFCLFVFYILYKFFHDSILRRRDNASVCRMP